MLLLSSFIIARINCLAVKLNHKNNIRPPSRLISGTNSKRVRAVRASESENQSSVAARKSELIEEEGWETHSIPTLDYRDRTGVKNSCEVARSLDESIMQMIRRSYGSALAGT